MSSIGKAHEIIAKQGWLSLTPASFRQLVLDRSHLQVLKAGSTIYSVGDPPGGMFGLVSGGLAISIAPGERGPYLAHFAPPGTWIGVAPAFTEQPRQAGLAVTRDTELLHLPLHSIREIVASDPGAWRFFGIAVIANTSVAIGAAEDLLIRDHFKLCIAVLLRLGGCRLRTMPEFLPIEIDVNQDGLAALTNLSRTTAGAILRKLQASGYLEVSYRRIHILAPDALRAILTEKNVIEPTPLDECRAPDRRHVRSSPRKSFAQ
jgi:CRP/FNR family transcriptional regulator, cyclic AMP receptor protein